MEIVKNGYIRDNVVEHKLVFMGIIPMSSCRVLVFFTGMLFPLGGDRRNSSRGEQVDYDWLEKELVKYFVIFLITSKNDIFPWNLVVVYGDFKKMSKSNSRSNWLIS
jgi:hypothetical protein